MEKREQNAGGQDRELRCDAWEDRIADALDGTLNEADAAAFRRHQEECALCAQVFKETQQGQAWMRYLAQEPEVPAGLLEAILARTSALPASGAQAPLQAGTAVPGSGVLAPPAWQRVRPGVLSFARQVLEPRLMMTVAMAFFSIALTLNLTGIKLTEVHAADLQPSRLRANVTRQYYSTNEQVMKYYANLRVVYEMEARVRELRRITETTPSNTPVKPEAPPRQAPRDGSGTPSSRVPSPKVPAEANSSEEPSPSALAVGFSPMALHRTGRKECSQALPGMMKNPAVAHPGVANRAERKLV